jgi:hypothetical protein
VFEVLESSFKRELQARDEKVRVSDPNISEIGEMDELLWKHLQVVDNLLSVDELNADILQKRTTFTKLLVDLLKGKGNSSLKNYAAETAAVLVQNSALARESVIKCGGMDTLLQSLSVRAYKPKTYDLSSFIFC